MERIEAAEELLEEMKECFLNGTSLEIKANDFNIVSWLIREVKREAEYKKEIDRLHSLIDRLHGLI